MDLHVIANANLELLLLVAETQVKALEQDVWIQGECFLFVALEVQVWKLNLQNFLVVLVQEQLEWFASWQLHQELNEGPESIGVEVLVVADDKEVLHADVLLGHHLHPFSGVLPRLISFQLSLLSHEKLKVEP